MFSDHDETSPLIAAVSAPTLNVHKSPKFSHRIGNRVRVSKKIRVGEHNGDVRF